MEFLINLYVRVREFHRSLSKGQTMAEYALILGAVAVVVFVSYRVMGQDITKRVGRVADILEDAS